MPAVINVFSPDYVGMQLIAQTPSFVRVLADWANMSATASVPDLEAAVCEMIRAKEFYPKLHPDLLSFPVRSVAWDDAHAATTREVANVTCDQDVAGAVCAGAPCYGDPTSGPLNVTCLCPVFPHGTPRAFSLAANDVGHFGGCEAYAYPGGRCAFQTTDRLAGDADYVRRFAVAAVRSMTTAPRGMAQRVCRDWFGAPDYAAINLR